MWTRTNWGISGMWTPNHFVPLTSSLPQLNQSFTPTNHSSPIKMKTSERSDIADYESETEPMHYVVDETNCSTPNAKPPQSSKESKCTTPVLVSSNDLEPSSLDNDITFPKPDNINTLQHGNFLSALDCWKAAQAKRFNLGSFYVTSIVYKNVNRKETKDNPIFAGPMVLHKDASYTTYRGFFSHISATLELRLHETIEFGSDDEKAMTKAIEKAFPTAKRNL
ncbi:Hypothetical predicted protein [Mytilus galloprovincialis]|uniref:Uncharacterized protein n=1 Tax=Mytilus galloprovincialis TaxID=29158 RepID=A0A8B6H9N2_MYTGA|nr:Hypothetical predicted protein [Mytilus galloprovincialis]